MERSAAAKIVLCLSFLDFLMGRQDLTLQKEASGCDAAKASIDKVTTSGIFKKDDNFLLTRLSLVSDFGKTSILQESKGIWQTNSANLKDGQEIMRNLNLTDDIRDMLGIEFDKATLDDLSKPLYSVVLAVLLIEGQLEKVPQRSKVEDQADFWILVAGITNSTYKDKFLAASKVLNENKGDKNSGCFVCEQSPTDILFIVDDSRSIDYVEWNLQVTFIVRILDEFRDSFDSRASQGAFIMFSTGITQINPYTTNYSLLSDEIEFHIRRKGNNQLPQAITKAAEVLKTDPNTRLNNTSVRKIVFVFAADRSSEPFVDLKQVSATLHQLPATVFSIGMKKDASMKDLQELSSGKEFARMYANVHDFTADLADILYDTCLITLSLGANLNLTESGADLVTSDEFQLLAMKVGNTRYFQTKYSNGSTSSVTVTPKTLDLVMYTSSSLKYPNQANYDFKTACLAGGTCQFVMKTPINCTSGVCQDMKHHDQNCYVTVTATSSGNCTDCVEDVHVILVTERGDSTDLNDDYAAS